MTTLKPRNPHAHAPILRKGGAHQSSRSGARFAGKQALLAELADWQYETDDLSACADHPTQGTAEQPGCGPVFLRLLSVAAKRWPQGWLTFFTPPATVAMRG